MNEQNFKAWMRTWVQSHGPWSKAGQNHWTSAAGLDVYYDAYADELTVYDHGSLYIRAVGIQEAADLAGQLP